MKLPRNYHEKPPSNGHFHDEKSAVVCSNIKKVSLKDSSVLSQEVTSIGDAIDVIRSKWAVQLASVTDKGWVLG